LRFRIGSVLWRLAPRLGVPSLETRDGTSRLVDGVV
jgi:hypothetical protein